MGGYGAFRLGALHPDRFAGFITWVGHTGDVFNGVPPFQGQGGSAGAVGNVYEFVGNFRNLPGAMLFAGADELIHVSQAIAMGQQFQAQQVPHIWYLHPVAEHLTFAALDDWQKESDYTEDLALDHHPGRVTFRTDPTFGNAALGIAHDRAYWVSQIRNRGPGYADVDATTHGCGATLPVLEPTQGAGPAPVPWVSQGLAVVGHTPIPPGNELEATLTNVASVTIDVAGACLSTDAVNYRLATDGPVTLTLSDGRAVTVGAAGTHTGVLAAVAAAPDPAPAPTGPRTLPATGASAAVAAPLVLLALALIGRRCAS
jgi:hypothetical protein